MERQSLKSGGNVFADLGFSPAESRNLRLRSEMITALRKFIEKEGLTQAEAAARLKVSQPRISDLARGKISRFSLDTLVNMLSDAGLEVDLHIKPPSGRVTSTRSRLRGTEQLV
jgi:predicted XRE-type DNA-binding protein